MTGIEFIDQVIVGIAANVVTYQLCANGLVGLVFQKLKARFKCAIDRVGGAQFLKQRVTDLEASNTELHESLRHTRAEVAEAEAKSNRLADILEANGKAYRAHVEHLEEELRQMGKRYGRG